MFSHFKNRNIPNININKEFITSMIKKYTKYHDNRITVGQYIIERLMYKNINVSFGYNKLREYSPFFNIVNQNYNFNIVFNDYEETSGKCALTYSQYTNNIGIILSTSRYGFGNLIGPLQQASNKSHSLLLLSFYNKGDELKISPFPVKDKSFIKESLTIKQASYIPTLLEYILIMTETPPKGPAHLNISNHILQNIINLKDIERSENKHNDEKLQKLQKLLYIEDRYNDKRLPYLRHSIKKLNPYNCILPKSSEIEKRTHPSIVFSRKVCSMYNK